MDFIRSRILIAQSRRLVDVVVFACILITSLQTSSGAENENLAGTREEYDKFVAIRQLISEERTRLLKIRMTDEISREEMNLAAFKKICKTPDSRVNERDGSRLISNEKLRSDGDAGVKRTEDLLKELRIQEKIINARAQEFENARTRGFIIIRNGTGLERNVSPVGFKSGHLLFIADDLIYYTFPLDDIQYGTLVEAVRFLKKHIGGGSYIFEDLLKVPEPIFFEKIATLDVNINREKTETGKVITVKPSEEKNNSATVAQLQAMRDIARDLRNAEFPDSTSPRIRRLEEEADKTNSPALCQLLADEYLKSEKKFEKARRYAEKAAQQGYSPAFVTLGNSYNEEYLLQLGYTKEQIGLTDYDIARKWYEKAVEKREPGAYWELGKMYLWGRGVPVNERRGCEYIRNAAFSTDKVFGQQACFMMALMYYYGNGVEKNHVQALEWLKACMNQSCESATGRRAQEFLRQNTFETKK